MFLFGSLAPDIPLILLTVLLMARDALLPPSGGARHSLEWLFREGFYSDPWVITAHNLFHAPIPLLLFGAIGYAAWRRDMRWGPALLWFAAGCMLHTIVDIPLHYDDGPLVFFPFDWQTRFHSPVSYWDPRRFGIPAAIVEHLLVAGMLVYLTADWFRSRSAAIKT
jgi:hypothetical protein